MFVTRLEHDILTVHHNDFLLELNSKYKKRWNICGATFLNISQEDKEKLTNILF